VPGLLLHALHFADSDLMSESRTIHPQQPLPDASAFILGGRLKTGHQWTPERVFRTFGGGPAESAGLVIESGLMSAKKPRLQSRAAQVSNGDYTLMWFATAAEPAGSGCRRITWRMSSAT
jgi:hypothetical protein